jgi:membrane carboxypeptidase/penicillin-binding protein PbpC
MVNEKGKVMDVSGGKDNENQNIIMYKKHGGLNQQWDVVYADEYPDEPKKGEMNEKFGLYVERPFYIVTQLSSHRYLDLINNVNMVIKTPNGRNTQTWFFDQKTLTIKTQYNKKSWDIVSSGKTNKMQVYSTNTKWW